MNNLVKLVNPAPHLSRMKWEAPREELGNPDILGFGTADMDFAAPEPILQALRNVLDCGHLGYPKPRDEFYDTISQWLLRTTGWQVDAKSTVVPNGGVYFSLWNIISELTNPGDEVIIQSPVHFCFNKILQDNGRVAVENPLVLRDDHYEMDFEQLEQCFTEKTKLFWLCNPHNPVGRAWRKEELEKLGEICLKHKVWIISDDVYCGLLHQGQSYVPMASISPEISNITLTAYSTSKSYNTTGLRFSFVLTESQVLKESCQASLQKLDMSYGINVMGLEATIAAYRDCDPWLQELMGKMDLHRAYLAKELKAQLPQVTVLPAEATYFAWVDLRKLQIAPADIGTILAREAGILVENGLSFGETGSGFIRVNLACAKDTLEQGVARMIAILVNYQ